MAGRLVEADRLGRDGTRDDVGGIATRLPLSAWAARFLSVHSGRSVADCNGARWEQGLWFHTLDKIRCFHAANLRVREDCFDTGDCQLFNKPEKGRARVEGHLEALGSSRRPDGAGDERTRSGYGIDLSADPYM